jgi:hypothetical protein
MSGINIIDSLLQMQLCENEALKTYVHQFNTDMSDYDALSGAYRLDDYGKASLVKHIPEAPIVPKVSTNVDQRFNLVPKRLVANGGGSRDKAVQIRSTKTVYPVRIFDSPNSDNFWCTWPSCSACFPDLEKLNWHRRRDHIPPPGKVLGKDGFFSDE